jgi:histidine triad (HIT) family protein
MPSVFTRIMSGELPGRILLEDERCVALLTAAPIRPGHALVVPREEIDHWLDLPDDLAAHLTHVAARVGRAVKAAFPCEKIGLVIAGLEVRHVHLHLVPMDAIADLDFSRQDKSPDQATMDDAAERIRRALQA